MSRIIQTTDGSTFSITASDYGLSAPVSTTTKCEGCGKKYTIADAVTHYDGSELYGKHLHHLYTALQMERTARQALQQQVAALTATVRHLSEDQSATIGATVAKIQEQVQAQFAQLKQYQQQIQGGQPGQHSNHRNSTSNHAAHPHSTSNARGRNQNGGDYIQQREAHFAAMNANGSTKPTRSRARASSASPSRDSHNSFRGGFGHFNAVVEAPLPDLPPPVAIEEQPLPTTDEEVVKQLKINLNKISGSNYEKLSNRIIQILRPTEEDGKFLDVVVEQIFEKALGDSFYAALYARLCKRISNEIAAPADKNVKSFRNRLLNRLQQAFLQGLQVATEHTVMNADDTTVIRQKQRMIGCVRFIGQLYIHDLLIEKIMHAAIQHTLTTVKTGGDDHTVALCELLSNVGQKLESTSEASRDAVNQYFTTIDELRTDPSLTSRSRFLLLDVVELRKHHWVPRKQKLQTAAVTE